jgi:predicted secreted hydrolase
MSKAALVVGAVAVVVVAAVTLARWSGGGPDGARTDIRATLAVREALGGSADGYARALTPRPLVFPEDHGPHPDFRTEWWYYTGNVRTAAGRHLGFQLTFFRVALAPPSDAVAPARASAWATRQLFIAHFALTDTAGGRFRAVSRVSRGALGLAGAEARPFRVWVEDWSVEGEGAEALPMRLRAAEGDVALDLTLTTTKPVVLQGERGLSRKGAEPGNASHYYSLTRMPATGVIRVGVETLPVTGHAWMDREWSTSALGPDVVGWDWFALQLDDGHDLMVYVLRRRDGSADPFSAGTVVAPDGTARSLAPADVSIETLAWWTSPRTAVRYPAGWRVVVPSLDLQLDVRPRLADQELVVGTRYWEGAVAVTGGSAGQPVAGVGYVELVGYGE